MRLNKLPSSALCGILLAASLAWADDERELAEASIASIEGPAPPEAPLVMSRDGEGRVTLRAVRLDSELTLDGRLEENFYRTVPAIDGFIQQEPHEGQPATESTEVWVFFDDDNVYISARNLDSRPDRIVANERRCCTALAESKTRLWWWPRYVRP